MLCILMVMIVGGAFLLAIVYNIPTAGRILNNMEVSSGVVEEEGAYPVITDQATSQLDNYTDSIMLLKAAYSDDSSPFGQAMEVRSGKIDGNEANDTLVNHFGRGVEFNSTETYDRYWHGYLVFLKPLLLLFSYKKIRIINAVAQILFVVVIIVVMVKKRRKYLIAPFLILLGFLMPLAIMKSMQFSSCFYVMLGEILALLLIDNVSVRKTSLVLFSGGIALAFFDLLTYPLITFGVPAALFFLMHNEKSFKTEILDLVKIGLAWLVGYAGMWFGKWTIGSVILQKNLFSDAIRKLFFRASTEGVDYSRMDVIGRNFESFFHTPIFVVLLVYLSVMITLIVVYWKNQKRKKILIFYSAVPFLIIASTPILWLMIVTNHSFHHYWFVNKIFGVTIFAIMCCLIKIYLILRKNKRLQ